MKLQIVLDGKVIREGDLPTTLIATDHEAVTSAMLAALRLALRNDLLTPSQALRVKLRLIDNS